jgi:hypothetical protein
LNSIAVISPLYLTAGPIGRDARLEAMSRRLAPAVTERMAGFRTAEQRNQTIIGRGLLALALADAGCAAFDLAALGVGEDGGPVIPEGFAGSISHTAGAVGAIAGNGGAIGLDLEHRRQRGDDIPDQVSASSCPHHEDSCDCRLRDWVAREAVAKAARVPLEDLLLAPIRDGWVSFGGGWPVQILEAGEDLLAAVAVQNAIVRPQASWLTISAMFDRLDP